MAKAAAQASEIKEEDYNSAIFEDGGSVMIDMSNIKAQDFGAIPKGIYNAVIDQVEFGKSKSSDNWMFTLKILLADNAEYNGRTFYTYISFSPKAIAGSKATLLKIDPELFSGKFDAQKIANEGALLGKQIRVKIGDDEYEGETVSRVKSILPFGGGTSGASAGGDSFFN